MTGDDRFAYAFTGYSDSVFPIQIWDFDGGRFHNTTRAFPVEIRQDRDRWWKLYLKTRDSTARSGRGVLAAYLADEYLLGQERQGWSALRKAEERGDRSLSCPGTRLEASAPTSQT